MREIITSIGAIFIVSGLAVVALRPAPDSSAIRSKALAQQAEIEQRAKTYKENQDALCATYRQWSAQTKLTADGMERICAP